jgi:hypothetical protein
MKAIRGGDKARNRVPSISQHCDFNWKAKEMKSEARISPDFIKWVETNPNFKNSK